MNSNFKKWIVLSLDFAITYKGIKHAFYACGFKIKIRMFKKLMLSSHVDKQHFDS